MGIYIYENGHINAIQPYYFMYNGQRYNAAHFNGNIVFGKFDEVEPTVPPTEPPTEPPTIPPTPTPEPPTTTPFFVENITNENETLRIINYIDSASQNRAPNISVFYSTDTINWSNLGTTHSGISRTLQPGERIYLRASTTRWGTHIQDATQELWLYNAIRGVSKVGGNILSLVYGYNFTGNETTFPSSGGGLRNPCVFLYLFYNNTKLQDASQLIMPVATLEEYCYKGMFYNCRLLNSIRCDAVDMSATGCLTEWTYNVAASGTFYKKAGVTWPTGIDGIPTGWTIVEV